MVGIDGEVDGEIVGDVLGDTDGIIEGLADGLSDGFAVESDGLALGACDGLVEGFPVGQKSSVSSHPTFIREPSDTVPTQPEHASTEAALLGHVTVDAPPGSTMVATVPDGLPGAGTLMELVVPAGVKIGEQLTLQLPAEFDADAQGDDGQEEEQVGEQLAGRKIAV